MNSERHEQTRRYRIVFKHSPTFIEMMYCDDRDEAIVLANELGGRAESLNGVAWQPILKVVP